MSEYSTKPHKAKRTRPRTWIMSTRSAPAASQKKRVLKSVLYSAPILSLSSGTYSFTYKHASWHIETHGHTCALSDYTNHTLS